MKLLYLAIGSIGLFLTVLALILPIVPATPFLVIALFGFFRGSQRMHEILINLPFIKPLYLSLHRNGKFTVRQKFGLSFLTLPMAIFPFILVDSRIIHLTAVAISAISIVIIWCYRHPVIENSA